ncbi:MAG: hypothetical protein ACRCTQ_01105 [Brevinemataceae bacterium]
MEIKGIGGINPTDFPNKKHTVSSAKTQQSVNPSDSLNVSDEARFLEDEIFVKKVLDSIPDIDQERINIVKKRLEDRSYDTQEVIDKLTENLIKTLGL